MALPKLASKLASPAEGAAAPSPGDAGWRDFAKQKSEIGKQQKETLKLSLGFICASESSNLNLSVAAFAPMP